MLSNYLKIAFRNFKRNRAITLINLAGLSIGLATCLFILLFVQHELGYDRFHEKADRIVRMYFGGVVQGNTMNEANVMPPVAAAMKADFTEVEDATRLRDYGLQKIMVGEERYRDCALAFVDGNFFSMFTLPFVAGDPNTALTEANRVVISESTAKKFFKKENPIGKLLKVPDLNANYEVTGVMRDLPHLSHFQFDLLVSMATLPEAHTTNWMESNFYTYLLLQKGGDRGALEAQLPALVDKYIGPQIQQAMGISLAQFREKGNDLRFGLQALTDIYLHSDFATDLCKHGDVRYVWIFGAIAAFMLFIACINFMNLSTAGAIKRAREVGIRKAVGSGRGELVRQFLLESMLMSFAAMTLALVLAMLSLPFVQRLSGLPLAFDCWENAWILPGLLAFALITGLLAGIYPAFFMSSFRLDAVLKSGGASVSRPFGASGGLRSGLVVFQFVLSAALIICSLVVHQQLRFVQTSQLGFDQEALLVLPSLAALGKGETAFRERLRQDARIEKMTFSYYLPAGTSGNNNFFLHPEDDMTALVKTLRYDVDEHYLPTLGIRLAAGRNFSPSTFSNDTLGMLVNEAAAAAFGWGENPIGKRVKTQLRKKGESRTYEVIGMVKNFHFRSMHERISPLVMVLGKGQGQAIVKVPPPDAPLLLREWQTVWAQFSDEPFAYSYMDERVRETYRTERSFGLILGIFTGLIIFVACLGLFGLATFTAERRTKEISIRKVLGASVLGITGLLAKDFLKLVLLAILIASPIAHFLMQRWLSDFAYRIDIQWWMFVVAGAGAVVIAFLTVSYQSVKAALVNPVRSL